MKRNFPDEKNNLLFSGNEKFSANEELSEKEDKVRLNIKEENDAEYYPLGTDPSSRSLLFSLLSIVFAALSLFIFTFYYLSIPFAILSIVFALISRARLGYFDKGAVFGMIFAIFGLVFGIGSLVLDCLGYLDAFLGRE